jgi:hypothetical protein
MQANLPTLHDLFVQFILYLVANRFAIVTFGGLIVTAIVFALPDPDNPEDWQGAHWRYRIFFRAIHNFVGRPMSPTKPDVVLAEPKQLPASVVPPKQ